MNFFNKHRLMFIICYIFFSITCLSVLSIKTLAFAERENCSLETSLSLSHTESIPDVIFQPPSNSNNLLNEEKMPPEIHTAGKKRLKKKGPSIEKLKSAKDIGTITWSMVTGGPTHIDGPLSPPSDEEPEIIALKFLEEKKNLYDIKNPHKDLHKVKHKNDECGTTIHFEQLYKGIPVENRLIFNIAPNGVILSIRGIFYSDIILDINPKISAAEAKKIAQLQREKEGGSLEDYRATEPSLLIWPTGDGDYLLWHFEQGDFEYFIDAHEGTVRGCLSSTKRLSNFTPATGYVVQPNTPINNQVTFRLDKDISLNSTYYFRDDLDTGTEKICIFNANNTTASDPWNLSDLEQYGQNFEAFLPPELIKIVMADDSDPNVPNDPEKNIWVSSLYYARTTANFYEQMLGREYGYSGDPNHGPLAIVVNNLSITCWKYSLDCIVLYKGDGGIVVNNAAGSLDAIAHEFSHAVTSYEGKLNASSEAATLDEAFSDMMACAVEFWLSQQNINFINTFDWTHGEDIYVNWPETGTPYVRNASNPKETHQPDTYPPEPTINYPDDPNNVYGFWAATGDIIHINSGVPCYMFYLFSEGGTHNGITVKGIGILNASLIMYRANANQWTSTETFASAREGCLDEAVILDNYNGTNWRDSVQNAWAAVGVGKPAGDEYEPDNLINYANEIVFDVQQAHSIYPVGDNDWMIFTVSETSLVKIETSGPSGDTLLWLRDEIGNIIEYNDDFDYSLFSRIVRQLEPGTYYIEIDEYGDNHTIPSYYIGLSVLEQDVFEPDNSSSQANFITSNHSQTHSIIPEDDNDWIKFEIDCFSNAIIETSGTVDIADTYLHVYDAGLNQIAYDDDSGVNYYSKISLTGLMPGVYYIKIHSYNYYSMIESYNISLTIKDIYEPDSNFIEAKIVGIGEVQTRSIIPENDIDYIRFDLPYYAYTPKITIETAGLYYDNTRMWLYDVNFNQIAYDDDSGSGLYSKIIYYALPPGTYYIKIDEYNNDDQIEVYNISVNVSLIIPDSYEPDNTSQYAKPISINSTQTHSIAPPNDIDWIFFDLPWNPQVPTITIKTNGPADDDTRLWLYNAGMGLISFDDDGGLGLFSKIEVIGLPPGRYYLKIDEYGNNNVIEEYSVEVKVSY